MINKRVFIIIHKKYIKIFCILMLTLTIAILTAYYLDDYETFFHTSPIDINYTSPVAAKHQTPKLAIIIDDFGQNSSGVKEMMEIDRHLTFAVMPFLKFSRSDAVKAHKQGYEIIVHLPMQSQDKDIASWLGPRPVKLGQTNDEIRKIVMDSLNSIPYAVGANIHMGTKASENKRVMSCVMNIAKEKKMYFVDSKTSSHSVCTSVAKSVGLRYAERNIFLETISNKSKEYIKKQLHLAGELALKKGSAIAIGHVGSAGGKVTAEAIKEMLPSFERKGIKLVYVSELF